MSRSEVVYVILLTAAAISFHFAHVPLALGLLVVIPFLRALPGRLPFRFGALALLAAPLALAVASLVAVQVVTRSETSAAPHGHLFLLARFIADGPAKSYLESNCPHGKFALCEYLDRLGSSSDDFLWNRDSPLYQIGVNNLRDEAKTIVRGSLLAYPAWHARLAFESTVAQLTRFNTGSSLISFANKGEAVNKVIKDHFPGAYEAFVNSRQYTKRLSIKAVRTVHYYIVVLSAIAALPLAWILLRRHQRLMVALLAVIVTGLAGNAFICAALSNITDRYQSRIIWLLVLFALLAAVPLLAERRRRNPGNNP